MTPKEKAKEIYLKFYSPSSCIGEVYRCQELALIVINYIINALCSYDEITEEYLKKEFGIKYFSGELQNMDSDLRFWEAVKKYIEDVETLSKIEFETTNN